MTGPWHRSGSLAFWLAAIGFFLALELALRIKLGSIFMLAGVWALIHQELEARHGEKWATTDLSRRFLFSLYVATGVSAWIFLVFEILNAALRSFDNNLRWFQLP